MKKLCVIAAVGLMVFPMSSCSNEGSSTENTASIEQNARAAEEAEKEFTKVADLKKIDKEAAHEPEKAETKKVKKEGKRHVASVAATYVVHVGAFKVKENAENMQSKLKADGFPVLMRPMNHSKNGLLYIVQLEPTPNKNEAVQWKEQLKSKSSVEAQLVSHFE